MSEENFLDEQMQQLEKDLDDEKSQADESSLEEPAISATIMNGQDWENFDFAALRDILLPLKPVETFRKKITEFFTNHLDDELAACVAFGWLKDHLTKVEYKKRRKERQQRPERKAAQQYRTLQERKRRVEEDLKKQEQQLEQFRLLNQAAENSKKKRSTVLNSRRSSDSGRVHSED